MPAAAPLSEAELQRLVAAAQDGDAEAFEKVYEQFFLPIYRYTSFRVSSDIAEDLVAEVFVKAWEKLHQYKVTKGVPFGAWLFRIARHAIIDVYRKDREMEEVSEELADPDDFNRADAGIKRRETIGIVRQALQQLPTRYREVLLLSYIAELPNHEVARVLKMTEGGMRILKFRALKKLESILPPDLSEHV